MLLKSRLTKSAVIAAAVDLLNAEGPDALTLNRLANELGIRSSIALQPYRRFARPAKGPGCFERQAACRLPGRGPPSAREGLSYLWM